MKLILKILLLLSLLTSCEKNENSTEANDVVVTSAATFNVIVEENITYAQGLSHQSLNSLESNIINLNLDVYKPNNNAAKRPAMVLIHGGGFSSGSKNDPNIVNLANFYASRGWVVFSINYRLLGNRGTVPNAWVQYGQNNIPTNTLSQFLAIYPAHRDAKAAIRWVVANAETYNLATNYITVGGGSAGAITATTLGITNAEDYTNEISINIDPTLSSTNLNQTYTIKTIIDFWGSDVAIDALNDIYGHQRFDITDAPIFIAHGTQDTTVEFTNAQELRDNYIATGVDYEFYPLINESHGAWNATINGKRLEELAFDFIVEKQQLIVN